MKGGLVLGLVLAAVGILVVLTALSGRTAALFQAIIDPRKLQKVGG